MSTILQERLQRVEKATPTEKTERALSPKGQQDEQALLEKVRQNLYSRITPEMLKDESEEAKKRLRAVITGALRSETYNLPRQKEAIIVNDLMHDFFGLGPISNLIEDESITEIMVNGPSKIFYEREGQIYEASGVYFRDNDHVYSVIQKIVGPIGRRVDESSPMVDARLPDGSRVNVIIPPLSIDGPCITIRKFGHRLTAEDYLQMGSIDERSLRFLSDCVKAKANILITGGTGTGKSTFLNVLSAYIPPGERIVTIEDSAELLLQQPHVVRLESRPSNIEGKGMVTIRDLVRNSLRMRPDRIIVGEGRGAEALDLIQAMNTGHEGSLATIHANNPKDAISRLAVMIMMADENLPMKAILNQIVSSLDVIVHLSRMRDGTRKITEISEVTALEGEEAIVNRIIEFIPTSNGKEVSGKWQPVGYYPMKASKKFEWRGMELPEKTFTSQDDD